MEGVGERLDELAGDMIDAAEECFAAKRLMAGVALLYVTIDSMAWLDRLEGQEDVKPDDFIEWANRYVLPNLSLSCRAEDLYAARCGVLHSLIAESRRVRENRATPIMLYSFGQDAATHMVTLSRGRHRAGIVVRVEDLAASVRAGVAQFRTAIEADPEKTETVRGRLAKQFMSFSMPPFPK